VKKIRVGISIALFLVSFLTGCTSPEEDSRVLYSIPNVYRQVPESQGYPFTVDASTHTIKLNKPTFFVVDPRLFKPEFIKILQISLGENIEIEIHGVGNHSLAISPKSELADGGYCLVLQNPGQKPEDFRHWCFRIEAPQPTPTQGPTRTFSATGTPRAFPYATLTSLPWYPEPTPVVIPSVTPTLQPGWINAQIHWQVRLPSHGLQEISFISLSEGWVANEAGLFHTRDGGMSWETLTDQRMDSVRLDFVDSRQGWVRSGGQVYQTQDGGRSWVLQIAGLEGRPVSLIEFVTAQTGWASSGNLLYQSQDGGQTWTPVRLPEMHGDRIASISFTDPQTGWFLDAICIPPSCGLELFKTTNGGTTWQKIAWGGFLREAGSLHSMRPGMEYDFADDLHGWNVGSGDGIYATTDGGQTWHIIHELRNRGPHFDQLNMFNAQEGIANYSEERIEYVVKTTDGGRTWERILLPLLPDDHIQFVDPQHAIGTDHAWRFLTSQDGGQSWEQVGQMPCAAQFMTPKLGWGVGVDLETSKYYLCRTQDGGETWQKFFTPQNFRSWPSLYFIDESRGAIWENINTIFATDDGGKTWQPLYPSRNKLPLKENEGGWLLADKTIYRAEPQDLHWVSVLQASAIDHLNPVSDQVAFVSVQDERGEWTLLRTSDGGKNWVRIELQGIMGLEPGGNPFAFAFRDAQNGLLIAQQGAFRTGDGGHTWEQIVPRASRAVK